MNNISGNVTNKIKFEIDRKSWSNLDKFQKRISHVKKQLSSINGSIRVNAVVSSINKVTNATTSGINKINRAKVNSKKASDRAMYTEAYRMNKQYDAQTKRIRTVDSSEANMLSRLSATSPNTKMQAQREFSRVSKEFLAGKRTATEFNKAVNSTTSSLLRAESAARRQRNTMKSLRSSVVQATAAYTAFAGLSSVARTGMSFEGIQAGMKVFAGDDVGGEFAYIRAQAERLGISFEDAAKNYTKFSIVTKDTLSRDIRRQVFEGVGEYATVLQADAQQVNRAYNAINQMFSKETIMSEELKGQLSEALFGSVDIFAKAAGMSKKELFKAMENAELMALKVIPQAAKEYSKLANTNGALEEATKKTRAEMARFFNELKFGSDAIFKGGLGEGLSEAFRSMADFIKDNQKGLKGFGAAIGQSIKTVVAVLRAALTPITMMVNAFNDMFGDAGAKILGTVGAIWAMSKAVSMVAAGFAAASFSFMALVRNIARYGVITTAALAVEDVIVSAKGGDSLTTRSGLSTKLDAMNQNTLGQMVMAASLPTFLYSMIKSSNKQVDVNINTQGAENLIDVKVGEANNQMIDNALATQGG